MLFSKERFSTTLSLVSDIFLLFCSLFIRLRKCNGENCWEKPVLATGQVKHPGIPSQYSTTRKVQRLGKKYSLYTYTMYELACSYLCTGAVQTQCKQREATTKPREVTCGPSFELQVATLQICLKGFDLQHTRAQHKHRQ